MKRIMLLISIAAFVACNENNQQQEKKEEIKDGLEKVGGDIKATANSAGDYLNEQKKQAEEAINERIRDIDQTSAELKKEGTEKSEAARKKLEVLKADMKKKMEDVKNSSAATWDSTREAADQLMKKSDKEWTNFKQDFKDLFKKD
ncbi:hypothetical protein [Chitinophaga nivalis]|uniref:Lipoprotein n=1 Tax=Chitinophaga nivalis TaxID=2991709 RepID=A0ABT3IWA8_9BACT|nr:hypothetical protein [Chitinophaga nivalis]MCW3462320.1 hypothetical protein [Chitinophaga nivalis]MCW3487989.1 hypothetical protein [Chitinophaga nivalis]